METYPLQDGEQVLWSGAPRRRRRWSDEHLVLLVNCLLLVAAFVVATVVYDDLTMYVAVIVAAVFVVSTSGAQVRDRRARALVTTYLVTDRRIVFVAQWPNGAEFRWVWHHLMRPPRVRVDHHGTGTITFGASRWLRWNLAAKPRLGAWAPIVPELYAIPDAERVAELIRRARPGGHRYHGDPPSGR